MANEPTIELIGNAVNDPEQKTFQNGGSVTQFRIAVTPSYQDAQKQWKEKETLYFNVKPITKTAESQLHLIHKGARVLVNGMLTKRSYTTKQGEPGEALDVAARTLAVIQKPAQKPQGSFNPPTRNQSQADPWANENPVF